MSLLTPLFAFLWLAISPVAGKFFLSGQVKSVEQSDESQSEKRSFKYRHQQLKEEHHDSGVWANWTLEFVPDAKDQLHIIRATNGTLTREFTLERDSHERLNATLANWRGEGSRAQVAARSGLGSIANLTRGSLSTTTLRDGTRTHRLTGVTNHFASGPQFDYSYSNYDTRERIGTRTASRGASWNGLTYNSEGKDRLTGWTSVNERSGDFSYDPRGNRSTTGNAVDTNTLDQQTTRFTLGRGFGVVGSVNPPTTGQPVEVKFGSTHSSETTLTVDSSTGQFHDWYGVDITNPNAFRVDGLLKAKRQLAAGTPPVVAEAEQPLHFLIPPVTETLVYDKAGRLKSDGFWNYTWDGPSRLTLQVRKSPMLAPNIATEKVEFRYDADGRMVTRTRTITYTEGSGLKTRIETSKVLWAGWLPIMEERKNEGGETDIVPPAARRWFQWGPDLSETLDGAGGIGGLMAIHEENDAGAWSRTLYPIQDGLGNVTAVLNAADGKVVAEYNYGPFGEPLSESGEVDACPFRWQTKWYTPTSGQYYFGFRCYDPRFGRWLSRDPLGEDGGFNLYAYCGNDPVNEHDALGLDKSGTKKAKRRARAIWYAECDARIPTWKVQFQRLSALNLFGTDRFGEIRDLLDAYWRYGDLDSLEMAKDALRREETIGFNTKTTKGIAIGSEVVISFTPQRWLDWGHTAWTGETATGERVGIFGRVLAGIPFLGKAVSGVRTISKGISEASQLGNGLKVSGTASIEGAGRAPKLTWVENPNGVARSLDEAHEISQKIGIEIPKDILFKTVPAGSLGENTFARYASFQRYPSARIRWNDFFDSVTGKIIVRLDERILTSDEAIVAIFSHEMLELNGLRETFKFSESISFERLGGLIDPELDGVLHLKAWDVADDFVLKLRGLK